MRYGNAKDQFIGVKEFLRELPRITSAVARGATFVVTKHGKPVFRVIPVGKFAPVN